MERFGKARSLTKLDIRQGFHGIRMAEESEDLPTFYTRYGSHKYRVMPFGLTNGPAYFQRFVNRVFADCHDKFLAAFVDDLLIDSETLEDHRKHVATVLKRLCANSLQVALKKCEFYTRTPYLVYII